MSNWRKAIEQYKKENKEKADNFEFYDITKVMNILNIRHRETVVNWIKLGKLKPCKRGEWLRGKWYFDKKYIEDFKRNQITIK